MFWELSPDCGSNKACDPELDKEAWVSATLLDWGSCGRIAYVDQTPAGFVSYAAPTYVPRSQDFPSGPPSADAALLMTVHVAPAYSKIGLGRLLIQATADDLANRGIRALEAFGDSRSEPGACMAPADFFRSVGFKTVQADPHYPRLRMDLCQLPGWSASAGAVETMIEELLAATLTTSTTIAPSPSSRH